MRDLSAVRKKAWETRRAVYGPSGHAGAYAFPHRQPGHGVGSRALKLVILMHREAVLSEGQCCRYLGMDRVEFRKLCDAINWAEGFAEANDNDRNGEPYKRAVADVRHYRELLEKMAGSRLLPAERALDGAKLVTLEELHRRNDPAS